MELFEFNFNLTILIMAIGWIITEFEPLHFVLNAVKDKLPKHELIDYVFGAFLCWQCATLWAGLILTGDLFTAIIASFLTYIIDVWTAPK